MNFWVAIKCPWIQKAFLILHISNWKYTKNYTNIPFDIKDKVRLSGSWNNNSTIKYITLHCGLCFWRGQNRLRPFKNWVLKIFKSMNDPEVLENIQINLSLIALIYQDACWIDRNAFIKFWYLSHYDFDLRKWPSHWNYIELLECVNIPIF